MGGRQGGAPRSDARLEALRVLRSTLTVAMADLPRFVVAVTSAQATEGKTSTCVGLARSFGHVGARVVLVDLDLRKPSAHEHLGVNNVPGCTDVLLERQSLEECLQYLPATSSAPAAKGLYFLPAGAPVTEPTELLAAPGAERLLDALAADADIVIIDTPPVLPVADTLVIGRMAAAAILVVESRRTPATLVNRAKRTLELNHTRILGTVLTKVHPDDADDAYGYGYGGGGSS